MYQKYCGSVAASNPLFRLHSYYQQDGQNGQGDCQCTQFGPVSVGYEDSSSIATPDVCADPTVSAFQNPAEVTPNSNRHPYNGGRPFAPDLSQEIILTSQSYSVYRLATTFVFDACYTTVNNPNDVPETVDSLEEVFEACRSFRNVFVVPLPAESGFQYVCATTETFSTPTTCNNQAGFFVFSHDAGSTVSQLTRRRKRARARAMRDKRQLVNLVAAGLGGLAKHFPHPVSEPQREYCPKEMTACKVFGSEGAYEVSFY